jgi:S-ribosylhomocysteine lyase
VVTKFDLRLVQPNVQEIPTAPLHTIEHLLAGYLRDAPAGRRRWSTPRRWAAAPASTSPSSASPARRRCASPRSARSAAVRDHEGAIPGCSPERCGNWRDHSLPGARAWAAEVLARGLIVQETVLLPTAASG